MPIHQLNVFWRSITIHHNKSMFTPIRNMWHRRIEIQHQHFSDCVTIRTMLHSSHQPVQIISIGECLFIISFANSIHFSSLLLENINYYTFSLMVTMLLTLKYHHCSYSTSIFHLWISLRSMLMMLLSN